MVRSEEISRARFLAGAAAAGVVGALELAKYRRWGRPVVVSEFGTCTYEGAPERGGMGWDVVDYTKDRPEIIGDLVRSERTQAEYLTGLLGVFESMGLYAALTYTFVTPDAPHRQDPRHDLDLASYALVKPIWKTRDEPTAHWHWEPKEAYHALARHYAAQPAAWRRSAPRTEVRKRSVPSITRAAR